MTSLVTTSDIPVKNSRHSVQSTSCFENLNKKYKVLKFSGDDVSTNIDSFVLLCIRYPEKNSNSGFAFFNKFLNFLSPSPCML